MSKIILLAAVAFSLGVSTVYYLQTNTETFNNRPPAQQPATSAPKFAVEACNYKNPGDNCEIPFDGKTVSGVCFVSGAALACGPETPSLNPTETVNFDQ